MDTANVAILHLIYENKSFLGWEGVGLLMTSVLLSTTFDFIWVATVERHKILLLHCMDCTSALPGLRLCVSAVDG